MERLRSVPYYHFVSAEVAVDSSHIYDCVIIRFVEQILSTVKFY